MEPKKIFIRTLGIALGIVVILIGGIWYVQANVDEKFLVVQQARADIRNKEQALSALASLQGDAEKAKLYLPQIDRMLTTREQLLTFSTDIDFLAKQAGFSGSPKFKEDATPQSGDLQKTSFALSLEGAKNLSDLGTFFQLVERSKYFVRFGSIDLVRDGGTLRATMDGYVISFH